MHGDRQYAIGVLSGTSCDGVDAACCRIDGSATPAHPFRFDVEIMSYVEKPYPGGFRERLLRAGDRETARIDEICRLNVELGHAFADAANEAMQQTAVDTNEISVLGSHGHTVWHVPEKESSPFRSGGSRATLQIGDPSVIVEETGIETISNFRNRDVAVGGHGAPLAPFLDACSFGSESETRAVQNIGGIGNCTILPPGAPRSEITAFDTGPGNMVIDAVVTRVTEGRKSYDVDGELAAAGRVDDSLVDSFLSDPYFSQAPPKTTGREYFGREFVDSFMEAGARLSEKDLVASATSLTARSIANAYRQFVDPYPTETIVSGGGAYNPTLCEMLDRELNCRVRTLDELGMEPAQKEAALFALLAVATDRGIPGNVPRATGASNPVLLGSVTPGAQR